MSGGGRAGRSDVERRLAQAGLRASSWANGPGDLYSEHRHHYDKVLVAVSGSISFHLREFGRDFELREGERLDLPAETAHSATVGSTGVTCFEAHLPAGTLGPEARHLGSEW